MRTSTINADFSSDIQKVWDMVTDNSRYEWRSDIAKIETNEDGSEFTEYAKNGIQTRFVITEKIPYASYAFDIHNKHIQGKWTGEFSITPGGGTRVCFTEEIEFANPVVQGISYLFMNLKKMQERYIADLKNALSE